MADIKHLGYGSLAIQLTDEKQITLGPRETKHIPDDHFESDGIQKALQQGLIAILSQAEPSEKKPKSKTNPN